MTNPFDPENLLYKHADKHHQKAKLHKYFLNSIKIDEFPEWAAVVAFYIAVHHVERLAALENVNNENHRERSLFLSQNTNHNSIFREITILHDASHKARYGTIDMFRRNYSVAAIKETIIENCLRKIEKYVDEFFASQPKN